MMFPIAADYDKVAVRARRPLNGERLIAASPERPGNVVKRTDAGSPTCSPALVAMT
jgi:hypothetical protein